MATGIPTNRTNIALPTAISNEIIQKTQEASMVMRLARRVNLPGRGTSIPVILSDPEAEWVGETGKKPVKNPGVSTKILRAYKLAVIVPFSKEFRRDAATLYDALIERLPNVLGAKFDATVFGKYDAPGSDFDTLGSCTAQEIGTDTYDGLVDADTDISTHGGIVNGYAISPQARGVLLRAKDNDGRPLFINNAAEGAIPMILGARTYLGKAAYDGANNVVGFAGDWTQAMWGTVEGVEMSYSEDATLEVDDGNGGTELINLFQRNMFAVRAEIEVGFRCDDTVFNKLVATPEVSG